MGKHNLKEKKCKICQETKKIEEFPKWKNKCLICYREYCLIKQKERHLKYPEHVKYLSKKNYEKNKHRLLEQKRIWKSENVAEVLLNSAKNRALKYNLEFNLQLSDIVLSEFCPILGIKLQKNFGRAKDSSYSLDRIDNARGYIKGNVIVISWKANRLKSDGTIEEIEKVLKWMRSFK